MKLYHIKTLSQLTSTTVRTLQYYDTIGLLKPKRRTKAGYRLYSDKDRLHLQQIMTLKYLGLSLKEIRAILDNPNYSVLQSLKIQAKVLASKASKIQKAAHLLKYISTQVETGQIINWDSSATLINLLEINSMSNSVKTQHQQTPEGSELGKSSTYAQFYNPDLLYPIPRAIKRQEIGIDPDNLPFGGFDCWNIYELSWLNEKGKPLVAMAEIYYDCRTPFIIESKSLKLYFNSFNNAKFKTLAEVEMAIKKDLAEAVGGNVVVKTYPLNEKIPTTLNKGLEGICLDNLDISCDTYLVQPNYLSTTDNRVEETLYSDLLKSNCLVTKQPDWGSVQIQYKGRQINHEGLLRYIVSFRNHNEFHEQCIERIFVDIMNYCQPSELTVYGRYTRRGGLDINPFRTTLPYDIRGKNNRLIRQ